MKKDANMFQQVDTLKTEFEKLNLLNEQDLSTFAIEVKELIQNVMIPSPKWSETEKLIGVRHGNVIELLNSLPE